MTRAVYRNWDRRCIYLYKSRPGAGEGAQYSTLDLDIRDRRCKWTPGQEQETGVVYRNLVGAGARQNSCIEGLRQEWETGAV